MKSNKLKELKILLPKDISDSVSDLLLGMDADSVSETCEDTLICEINSYFDCKTDISEVVKKVETFISMLHENSGEEVAIKVCWQYVESSQDEWKKWLRTVKASKRVVIKPPWEEYKTGVGEVLVEINPSVAFGTGHHETTTLCIKYLDEIFLDKSINSILDVGCGSGILGICAAKLGAEIVFCLDNDPKAACETVLNSRRNSLSDKIYSFAGTLDSVNRKFDLVVSNIYAETLIKLMDEFHSILDDNGLLILSGITLDKKNLVIDEFSAGKFHFESEKTDGDWAALLFKSNSKQ